METSAVFCKTYEPKGESAFWRYPSHRVLATFAEPDTVAEAIRALKDVGVEDNAIEVLCGTEGEKKADFSGEKHGFWASLISSLQTMSAERSYLDFFKKELHAGHYVVNVRAEDSGQKEQVAEIFNRYGGQRVTWFGNWLIEEMPAKTIELNEYGFSREVPLDFAEAIARIKTALSNEGFGVLTEIDLKEKFREKLDKDFRHYVILGACNPTLAYEALGNELDLGLLLPCNVVVYEKDNGSVVAAIDAEKMLSVTGNRNLAIVAKQVNDRLKAALSNI